jgi:glutaredoxin-related protein
MVSTLTLRTQEGTGYKTKTTRTCEQVQNAALMLSMKGLTKKVHCELLFECSHAVLNSRNGMAGADVLEMDDEERMSKQLYGEAWPESILSSCRSKET